MCIYCVFQYSLRETFHSRDYMNMFVAQGHVTAVLFTSEQRSARLQHSAAVCASCVVAQEKPEMSRMMKRSAI